VVPALLDRLKLGYTGSGFDALVAAQSKLRMKQVLACAGLPTPAWSERGDGLPDGALVMVKSVDEHASVGIDRHSVVAATAAAAEIVRREEVFGGRFFAETFLDGREFNISLLEGPDGVEVLPIPEIEFVDFAVDRPRIVDYGAKWIEEDPAYHNTPRRFGLEQREPELAARLRSVVLEVWRAFGIRGYARVDLRVDGLGVPQVIDVNTNPCIAPDAGLAAAASEAGIGYDGLVQRIVAAAVAYRIARHGALPVPPRRRGSRIAPVQPELRVAGLTARA
jgi:D-alanine-D-alanine ligase